MLFMCLKRLVGERGFEPPTPWSRTWDWRVVLNDFNLLQWCFNRLIPAQSRHSGMNVSPRMAVPGNSGPEPPVLYRVRQLTVAPFGVTLIRVRNALAYYAV